VVGCA
jgi:palmitoyl-protein thioesterase